MFNKNAILRGCGRTSEFLMNASQPKMRLRDFGDEDTLHVDEKSQVWTTTADAVRRRRGRSGRRCVWQIVGALLSFDSHEARGSIICPKGSPGLWQSRILFTAVSKGFKKPVKNKGEKNEQPPIIHISCQLSCSVVVREFTLYVL